jgi:hypothetical protein
MIPGTTSKLSETTVASAASIDAKSDVVLVTGTTQVNTIIPHFGGGFGGLLILIPTAGSVILGTSGNILVGITAVINRAVYLNYVKSTGKWYINSGV